MPTAGRSRSSPRACTASFSPGAARAAGRRSAIPMPHSRFVKTNPTRPRPAASVGWAKSPAVSYVSGTGRERFCPRVLPRGHGAAPVAWPSVSLWPAPLPTLRRIAVFRFTMSNSPANSAPPRSAPSMSEDGWNVISSRFVVNDYMHHAPTIFCSRSISLICRQNSTRVPHSAQCGPRDFALMPAHRRAAKPTPIRKSLELPLRPAPARKSTSRSRVMK